MADNSMDLWELLRKRGMEGDVDFRREALRVLEEGIMDAEVSAQIGAQHNERNPAAHPSQQLSQLALGHPGGHHGIAQPITVSTAAFAAGSRRCPTHSGRDHKRQSGRTLRSEWKPPLEGTPRARSSSGRTAGIRPELLGGYGCGSAFTSTPSSPSPDELTVT